VVSEHDRLRVRGHGATSSAVCLIGIVAAAGLRAGVGAPDTAASMPAGVVFAAALLAVAVAAGWRPARPRIAAVALGAVGGGALILTWLGSHGSIGVHIAPINAGLALWTPVVALIAVAEEVALRGALFDALRSWCGDGGALFATTLLFALMHVPLYGIGSLPLDLAAGLLLGGLRMVSGGVLAPAIAHVIADLAGGWLL
jgi:membrane protease YdiL (CAAX protease family)